MLKYPGSLTPQTSEFDALELGDLTDQIVGQGSSRKYTGFYCTAVYGGVSTGYVVGCNLRCMFCCVDSSRDNPVAFGQLYSPAEVFQHLTANARRSNFHKLRLAGGEPTLCRPHLIELLGLIEQSPYLLILETNGILLGQDEDYVRSLTEFRRLHVRVSFKAATPDSFALRTGAWEEYYQLPFRAIEYLKRHKLHFGVAAMCDPQIMPRQEKDALFERIQQIAGRIHIEQERCEAYQNTLERLRQAGCTDLAEELSR